MDDNKTIHDLHKDFTPEFEIGIQMPQTSQKRCKVPETMVYGTCHWRCHTYREKPLKVMPKTGSPVLLIQCILPYFSSILLIQSILPYFLSFSFNTPFLVFYPSFSSNTPSLFLILLIQYILPDFSFILLILLQYILLHFESILLNIYSFLSFLYIYPLRIL